MRRSQMTKRETVACSYPWRQRGLTGQTLQPSTGACKSRRVFVGLAYLLGALCGSVGTAAPLASQGWPIILGDRVRVTAPALGSAPIVGTVVDRRVDALMVQRASGDTIAVPIASGLRVEVSYGHRRHPLTGAIVGAVSGAVIAGVVGASTNDTGPLALGRGGLIAVGAGMGSASGVIIGAGIGAIIRTERWHDAAVGPTAPPVISSIGWARSGAPQCTLAALAFPVPWLGY